MRDYKKLTAEELTTKKTITIPKWIISEKAKKDEMVYLSDFMECLPSNCIFLKGATGIGGTSLALSDTKPCIIAMPTRATVENKRVIRDENNIIIGYRKDVFAIMGGVNDSYYDLSAYLKSRNTLDGRPMKIVCTYDQVARLVERLHAIGINVRGIKFYIDEIHQVIDDMIDTKREVAIRGMMKCVKSFNDVCCLTATPLKREYFKMMTDIAHLRIVRVEFPNPSRPVESRYTPYLVPATATLILDHLEGREFGNAHIFVNSVNFIRDVLKKIDFLKYKDSIRVVCGDTKRNADTLTKLESRKILERDHNIATERAEELAYIKIAEELEGFQKFGLSSINSPVRKVNFYTKTAFQGCDIFDTDAQQYIISDLANKHTLLDIKTSFPQIVGRIRNSKNLTIIHLTNAKGRYEKSEAEGETQYEIDKRNRKEERAKVKKLMIKVNKIEDREILISTINFEKLAAETYYRYDRENNSLVYDPYIEIKDMSNRDTFDTYSSPANISAQLLEVGFSVSVGKVAISDALKKKAERRISFKKIFEEYVDIKTSPTLFSREERIKLLEGAEPLIISAYNLLGVEKVRELKHGVREIRRELQTRSERDIKDKIYSSLNLKYNTFYTSVDLKEKRLRTIKELGLTRPLRIADFYEVKATTQREMIGIVSGYRILGKKKLV